MNTCINPKTTAAAATPELHDLAQRVARLNPAVGEIGAGMLADLVERAQRALAGPSVAEGETHVATITIPGQLAYRLILLPGDIEATFEDAEGWAEGAGGVLPNRFEQAILFAHHRDEFQRDWYWSGQQHESDPDYVWCQYFGDGYQYGGHRIITLRARAVRRLPL